MSASPQMVAAFQRWQLAERASYFAAPCPDEVMNALVDRTTEALDALVQTPVASADDLLLKVYPTLLAQYEPHAGSNPIALEAPEIGPNAEPEQVARLMADLIATAPAIAQAVQGCAA